MQNMRGKSLKEKIKYWAQLLLLPVYGFSFLTIRRKNIWLFGSTFGRRFTDNPRYLYIYLNQLEHTNIRPIWITQNKEVYQFLSEKGMECYKKNSLPGIFWCLHAKKYIFDNYSKDINFWLSGGAVKVNLWHGVGNKRINYDNVHDQVRHPQNSYEKLKAWPRRLSDEKPSHYILATSPIMKEIFARAFQVPMDHVIEDGYPRNDMLFAGHFQNVYLPSEQRIRMDMKQKSETGNVIFQYYPTFRESETQFENIMNLDAFDDFLMEHHFIVYMKPHPKSKLNLHIAKKKWNNLIIIDSNVDIYSILDRADYLITDYSSVYSDFPLTQKPIILFQYDAEEYFTNTRDRYFDDTEYMIEQKATNQQELEAKMCTVTDGNEYLKEENIVCHRMFTYLDGSACERLTEKIQKL